MEQNESVDVSVVIPVRNNRNGIDILLGCLERQTLPRDRFEIIISDDGSSPDQIPSVSGHGLNVRLVQGPPRNSYTARNRGAAVARGRILAFCDSDCEPEPGWLEEALAALDTADIVAGEVTMVAPEQRTVWTLLSMDMFLDQERNVRFGRGVTANLVVKADLFHAAGAFDQSLPSGGDYDFVRRAMEHGGRLRYVPQAMVRHETLDTARALLRKVWFTNRWSAFRRARDREMLDFRGLLVFIPIVGVMVARLGASRPPFRLYRPRLQTLKHSPGWVESVLAVAAMYSVLCYVAGAARALGWLQGVSERGPRATPIYPQRTPQSGL
jgi:glycosyltransferase involved in cell wall biosynthesis